MIEQFRAFVEGGEAFGRMSGLTTCEVLRRQFELFGEKRFERLATVSNGHVCNLRGSSAHRARRTAWTKTGQRPRPSGFAAPCHQAIWNPLGFRDLFRGSLTAIRGLTAGMVGLV